MHIQSYIKLIITEFISSDSSGGKNLSINGSSPEYLISGIKILDMPNLQEILIQSAENGLKLQQDTGAMPHGNNGPWKDEETHVRNTAHWCITFLKTYELTQKERFLDAGEKAADYLLRDELRPEGETYICRTNPEKDRCNGLIGQAWIIEALSEAYQVIGKEEYHETAVEVFLRHPFDDKLGLWKTVEIDGEVLGYDTTFNHQLWFAASGSMLENNKVKKQVDRFMERLEDNLSLHESGLVQHKLSANLNTRELLEALREKRFELINLKLKNLRRKWKKDRKSERLIKRAIGYHSFNMYGFALLNQAYPDHPFWETRKFRECLKAINSDNYRLNIEDNMYGYPYNPPGIENAFALQTFDKGSEEEAKEWLEKQFEETFNFETGLMEKRASDKETCSARIYEATRLSDGDLELNINE